MPTSVVDIDLTAQTGAVPQDTYSDLILVASEPDPAVSNPTTNRVLTFSDATEAAQEFGTDSDAYRASQRVERKGTSSWSVILLDATEHTETLTNTDTQALNAGVVSNTPIRGGPSDPQSGTDRISVSVDGTVATVSPTTESPPTPPAAGEAVVNFDTGEVATGDTTSGAGAGIEVTYETLDWTAARTEMANQGIDLALLADVRADRSYIGDLEQLTSWASGNRACVVVAFENGGVYNTDEDAMAAAHDISAYLPYGNVLPIAHKSSNDVAAGVAGRLAVKQAWYDPYWDGSADFGFSTDQYRQALIGDPSLVGTFEGGQSPDGEGPSNVLQIVEGTQVLSNSLTSAGSQSNYQYFDVKRTENFVYTEIEDALTSLRLRRDQIPFTSVGRVLIEDAIYGRLMQYVGSTDFGDVSAGVPLADLDVYVPSTDEISEDDRANRVWSDIAVTGTLANNVHTFKLDLAVQV